MKKCYKCNKSKYLSEFNKDSSCKDGYMYKCKGCEKEYYKNNKETIKNKNKEYIAKNYQRVRKSNRVSTKKYYAKNKESSLKRTKLNHKKRIKHDISYKIACNLRRRLNYAVKGAKAGSHIRDLGCTASELVKYLESKFKIGMSWNNYGYYGWHIDHIIPLSKFDLTNYEHIRQACHYTNLQPLWWKENISKSNKEINAWQTSLTY